MEAGWKCRLTRESDTNKVFHNLGYNTFSENSFVTKTNCIHYLTVCIYYMNVTANKLACDLQGLVLISPSVLTCPTFLLFCR